MLNKSEEKKFEEEEKDKLIPDGLFGLAISRTFDAIMITTAEKGYPIVFVNKAFTEISGYSQHECAGSRNCGRRTLPG